MHFTVNTWDDFRDAWDGVHNFLMSGECVPFEFNFPPIDRVVEEMRQHPEARIGRGIKADRLTAENDFADQFRATPIERALRSPFSLAHFRLSEFDAPGKFLHGFKQRVLDRWQSALLANGFTYERCYPIVFISGPGAATNYHMDFSHVLAWQIYGVKKFCGLKVPGRWAPWRERVNYKPYQLPMPAGITADDTLCYDMPPGAVLWNTLLTPHWVEAGDAEVAMSINLSHGGLRLNGRLCPFEQELEDYRHANPSAAPAKVTAAY
jgi:hypothetical protein